VEVVSTFDATEPRTSRYVRHAQLSASRRLSTYKIARGEAMECAASLDVMRLRRVLDDASYDRGMQLLEGVVAMLTKML